MTKKASTPALRFKGFTYTWEQRKLGEALISLQNNTLSRADLSSEEGIAKNIHYGDILVKFGEVIDVKTKSLPMISDETVIAKYKSSFLQNGDIIVADTAEDETVGKCTEIAGLSDEIVISGLHTIPYRPLQKYAPGYLGYYMNSASFHNQLLPLMQGIKVTSISKTALQNTDILYPESVTEQAAIGTYFRNLDNLITLHQHKYDKLTNMKKSMLEKMFPKNGANVPEIRFKGFTDAWEQRKLSEITDKVTEKNAGLQYVETFTNSAEFGIISQRDFFDHDIAKLGSLDGYYIVKNEDFVYNPRISTSAPVGPINRNKLGRTGVMSPLYTVFRPHDIDTTYLEYFFKCGCWHSFMNFNGDSGARSDRFSIRDNVFFQMPIPIPDIDEQRKIGELLTCLNNLITLHQRELEKLKNFKKACLEKMFV